ncbi:MAG: type III pantothenate kinase, partial [Ardenticatenaceae bacterium]
PQIVGDWRATTDRERTPDEWAIHLDRFLALKGMDIKNLSGCIIASVVPPLTDSLQEMTRKYLAVEALLVSSETHLGIPIEYPRPSEIGPDRLANAVAVGTHYGAPAFVVDFGTSTNFDVVNERGAYIGGVLAPGLETSLYALTQRAARLFNVEFAFPPTVISRSTATAIQSGLMWGYVGLIEGIGARIHKELGAPCPVVATGGLAERLAPHTTLFTAVDPNLTVKGLYLIWERNQS